MSSPTWKQTILARRERYSPPANAPSQELTIELSLEGKNALWEMAHLYVRPPERVLMSWDSNVKKLLPEEMHHKLKDDALKQRLGIAALIRNCQTTFNRIDSVEKPDTDDMVLEKIEIAAIQRINRARLSQQEAEYIVQNRDIFADCLKTIATIREQVKASQAKGDNGDKVDRKRLKQWADKENYIAYHEEYFKNGDKWMKTLCAELEPHCRPVSLLSTQNNAQRRI